jgi:hypothetical protein
MELPTSSSILSVTQVLKTNQFYIMSALSGPPGTNPNPYVLTPASINGESDVLVEIQQWSPGDTQQIWIVNENNTISVYTDPSLLLRSYYNAGTSFNNVGTGVAYGNYQGQIWNYSNGMLSTNTLGGGAEIDYLNVWNSELGNGNLIVSYPYSDQLNEQWFMVPVQSFPPETCFYLQTEMSDASGDNAVYVITIPGNTATAGTQVVIDPLQPGSLNQLWRVNNDGYVVSALDGSLALTTTTSNKQAVTVEPLGTNLQYWHLFPNGWLAIGNSGAVYFANVADGGNASPGAAVITYQAENGSNALWRAVPHRPEGLWFTIQSGIFEPGSGSNALLTIADNGTVCLQQPLGGLQYSNSPAAINQLWKRTPAGNIVSAAIPNFALTAPASGGAITASLLEAGNASQVWTWGNGQAITVHGAKQKILAGTLSPGQQNTILSTSGTQGSQVTLAAAPTSTATNNELWFVLPHAMPYETSTTIRNAGDGSSPGLFLSLVDKADSSGGYEVQVGSTPDNATLSMWQYQYPGFIVNNANESIVLSLAPEANGSPVAPAYTSNVVAYLRQPRPQAFQLWDLTAEGRIVSRYNGQALAIPIPGSTPVVSSNVVTAYIESDGGAAYQVWEFAPGMALQSVLQQPALPFPAFTGDALTTYQKISARLGLPDGVRSQYMNLAAPLNTYQSEMNGILTGMLYDSIQSGGKTPTQADIQNCGNVINQLNKEITAVIAVQRLFQQATALYLSLSQGQVMTLGELITSCELPNGIKTIVPPPKPKKKKSWIGNLIEGITYTALNVAGSFIGDPLAGEEASGVAKIVKNGFPCFANLMSTGFDTFQAAQQSPGAPVSKEIAALQKAEDDFYNYEMSVAGLQKLLLAEFEALGTALGQVETLILADWGKLQAVSAMVQETAGMSSLYWPSTMTAMDTSQMLQSYALSVLKTLMPANAGYKISATLHTNYGSLENKGWQSGNYYMNNGDETQNEYSTNVAQNVMQLAEQNGMDTVSFFRGLNGWNIPVDYLGMLTFNDNSVPMAATIIITVENLTNVALELNLTLNNLVGTGSDTGTNFPLVKYSIPSYGAMQFAGGDSVEGSDTNLCTGRGLNGTNPGIAILAGGQQIFSVGVDNSYGTTIYKESADVPLCSYTFPGMIVQAPYNCTLTQETGASGMVFVKIAIML